MFGLTLGASLLVLCSAQKLGSDLDIYSLHVRSDISFRFATTHVTSRVANRATEAKEAVFLIQLPETAFISNFTMTIDGKVYAAKVKEKAEAKRIYQRAKKRGQSAAHVTQKSRHGRIFKVAVNVEALSKVTFDLTYQEHLKRLLGIYEHVIYVDPGQIVNDLKIDVYIRESKDLTFIKVPNLRPLQDNLLNEVDSKLDNALATITRTGKNQAHISYRPSIEDQRRIGNDAGVTGRFSVQYDVTRTTDGGELHVIDGYFVHYFAPRIPSGTPRSKNIIFVLDKSGSMGGTKMQQLKEAMQTILRQLQIGDYFNLITFDHSVSMMANSPLVPVNVLNLEKAKLFVSNIYASGSTNINDGLLKGMDLIREHDRSSGNETRPSMIVFLTDGHPTTGEQIQDKIVFNVKRANKNNVALYSLGFGDDLNFKLNQQLSLQNNGFSRKIYAEADAAIQLKDFYAEISTPLLSNVKFKYIDDSVDKDTLTKSDFNLFFNGSELVVAGKVKNYNEINNMVTEVSGVAETGEMVLDQRADLKDKTAPPGLAGLTERLWAYLTIKELLTKMEELADETKKEQLKNRAIQLSLKYNFVTPVTSMVVIKPRRKKREDTEDKSEKVKDKKTGSKQPSKSPGAADNDPHFIVTIGKANIPVCFDVMGKPGQIFMLLQDKGLSANGYIIPGHKTPTTAKHQKTYFGKIGVTYGNDRLVVTPTGVRLNHLTHPWRLSGSYSGTNMTVSVERKRSVTVTCGEVVISVLVHKTQQAHFLGFYLLNTTGLSKKAHGLLGQFYHMDAAIEYDIESVSPHTRTELSLVRPNGATEVLPVYAGRRRNMALHTHVPCWFVRNNGHGLLEGKYKEYLVKSLHSRGIPPELKMRKKLTRMLN